MSFVNSKLKKLVLVFLGFLLVFSLAGCKKTSKEEKQLKEVEGSLFLGDVSNVTADINLPNKARKGDIIATVTWVSSNEEVIQVVEIDDENFYKGAVTRPEADEDDVVVTLTATLKIGSKTLDKEFKVTVKAMPGATKATVAEAKAATKGEMLEVTGTIIYAITAGFTIKDSTGAIYVYSNNHTYKVGDKVKVTGAKDIYFDMPQISGTPAVEVLGTEEVKLADIAVEKSLGEIDKAPATLKEQFGAVYKIQGTVVDNGGRSNYALEDPLTGDVLAIYNSSKGLDELKEKKAAGQFVEMLVVVYDRHSGGYWRVLYVPGTVKDATAPEVSDEVKVNNAIDKLKTDFEGSNVFGSVTLPAADSRYEGLTITWVSNKPTVLTNEGVVGEVAEDTEVTLTATVKIGDETKTVDIKVTVKAATISTVKEARETIAADENTHQLWFSGIVVGLDKSGYFVGDEHTSIYVRQPGYTVKLGDKIEVKGIGQVYYGGTMAAAKQVTVQVDGTKPGYSVKVLESGLANPMPAPLEKKVSDFTSTEKTIAGTFGADFHGQFVKVTGKLVEVGSYNNLYLEDDEGNQVMVYYGSLDNPMDQLTKLVGKEVTLILLTYDQHIRDGWRLAFIGREGDLVVELTETEVNDFIEQEIVSVIKEGTVVNDDINLPTKTSIPLIIKNTRYVWSSDNEDVLGSDGAYTMPAIDTPIKLTLNVFLDGNETENPDKTFEINVIARGEDSSLPTTEILNIDFSDLVNKTKSSDWLTYEKYAGFTQEGNMGESYAGAIGFGRSGDKVSSLISPKLNISGAFDVELNIRGNASSGSMGTSYFTVEGIDDEGNVVATAIVLSDSESTSPVGADQAKPTPDKDSVLVMEFTAEKLVSGKDFSNIKKIKITYNKDLGNLGLKSLEITHKTN